MNLFNIPAQTHCTIPNEDEEKNVYVYIYHKKDSEKIQHPIISKQNLSGLILNGFKYNKKVKSGYISRGRLISRQNRNEKCYKLKYCLIFIAPLFRCVYSK
jgi:hypothetical protein